MGIVMSVLSYVWPFVSIILILYYMILSVYIYKPSSHKIEVKGNSVDKLTRKQIRDFNKSQLRSIKSAMLTQAVLAVLLALGMYLKHQDFLAVGLALLSAWKLFDCHTIENRRCKEKDHGVHNNGLIRCLSVIPVRDVDMNKVDKEIDKQLSEMEKMRR